MERSAMARASLMGHFEIMRFDHWTKNVFVLPGIVIALAIDVPADLASLSLRVVVGLLAVGLIASSNYVINEILDAPTDLFHPEKRSRPIPSGRVHVGLAYIQWIGLAGGGFLLGTVISAEFVAVLVVFWLLGIAYNLRPLRTKDIPYLDVTSEALNNPVRLMAGWFIVRADLLPPASLILSYWMVGCYFMVLKRFAEYREIGDAGNAGLYRRSFKYYDESRLLVATMFYAASSMLFFGTFLARYRLELVLSFPLVALVMAYYMALALRERSPVQRPELLYRERVFIVFLIACGLAMSLLFFLDWPLLHEVFPPGFIRLDRPGIEMLGAD
jgi:4-hydroxybenzoate polyprenyltransferase